MIYLRCRGALEEIMSKDHLQFWECAPGFNDIHTSVLYLLEI
jgi:hypothetical protein